MSKTAAKQHKDVLTGLPAHQACLERLTALLGSDSDVGTTLTLVDLDWFGKQNESLGEEEGDALLRSWAGFLANHFKGSGEAFRFGGDAVMVLLPGVEKEQGFLALEDARRTFEGKGQGNGKSREPLTFSGGVAASPDDGDDAETLVRKSSEALYRAKLSGRNKVCLAREEKMVTKTVHYRQGQLEGLTRLAKREGMNEASLLREALDDLLRKYNA